MAEPKIAEALSVLADHVPMPVDTRAKIQAFLAGEDYPPAEPAAPPDPRDQQIAALQAQLAQAQGQAAPVNEAPVADSPPQS